MSIASEITRINTNIAAAYSSCSDKGATLPQAQNSSNLADTIDSIPEGGSVTPPVPKDVNFFDYDGTLLYSYTLAEAAELTALPALPSHDGLVCQGWNYTLSQIQEEPYGVNVGCHYTTSDGSTKLYISAVAGASIQQFFVNLMLSAESTVTVDWGDGSSSELSNTDLLPQHISASHSYAAPASDTVFCIRIVGGSFKLGGGSSSTNLFGNIIVPLERVELGSNCTAILAYAFYNCYSLSSISIPSSVDTLSINAFYNCYNLKSVSIPSNVGILGNSTFYNCYSLSSVSIPSGVTSVGNYVFYNCYSLSSVSIPSNVGILGNSIFYNCYTINRMMLTDAILSVSSNIFNGCMNLRKVHFSETITSLSSNLFNNCLLLSSIAIPSRVTSIGSMAFYNCRSLIDVDLSAFTDPTNIPTLQGDAMNSVFYSVPAVFHVANAEMLAAFSTATNWSSLPSSRFQIKGA